MKKNNLLEGIAFILGGFIILCIALLTASKIDSILIGFGAGGISSGIVITCKYFYWNTPKNKERYQKKLKMKRLNFMMN